MSDTPLLALPYLAAAQAQKHVTLNEALSLIDGHLHLAVLSRSITVPPAAPQDGDRYLVPPAATAEWAGHDGAIALRMDGAWRFLVPREGWRLWVCDEDLSLDFDGTSWIAGSAPTSLQNMALLGVNATADAAHKLAVSSAGVLLNHAGNGVQLKLNKNAPADTASLLLQTGFSGRAEIGLAGDDALRIKTSANGASFVTALQVDAASGSLTLGHSLLFTSLAADPPSPVDGQLWLHAPSGHMRIRQQGRTRPLASLGLAATCTRHLITY